MGKKNNWEKKVTNDTEVGFLELKALWGCRKTWTEDERSKNNMNSELNKGNILKKKSGQTMIVIKF